MRKKGLISIGKFGQEQANEDCALYKESLIAVSDGAGGGGIYADLWAAFLLNKLPDEAITSFEELDNWVDSIWEEFYVDCENRAKRAGGMVLSKFYDEGSFATLAAVWRIGNVCKWMTYGDSVVFCYHKESGVLEYSFTKLEDFDKPPYLINYKDRLHETGFKSGEFRIDSQTCIFCATDALAHYILMMYEVAHKELFAQELSMSEFKYYKNANYIKVAMAMCKVDFDKDVLSKLFNCLGHATNFQRHIKALYRKGLIACDDYSLAYLS